MQCCSTKEEHSEVTGSSKSKAAIISDKVHFFISRSLACMYNTQATVNTPYCLSLAMPDIQHPEQPCTFHPQAMHTDKKEINPGWV
jgi:hypothetical protein